MTNLSYKALEGCCSTPLTSQCPLQGVVKALREQGLLPRVIAGSSVGSIGEHCQQGTVLASPACIERVFTCEPIQWHSHASTSALPSAAEPAKFRV